MAYSVFDIMVNDESVQKTLKDGYESLVKKDFNKNGKISYHINTLTNALIESCKKLNIEEMEELCTLYSTLMHVVDKNVDMSWEQEKFIETRLQQVCCNISIEFGYNKMLEQIVDMFNTFEASTDFIIAKYKIWTKEFNVKFLFMLYCQYYDLIGGFCELSEFFSWNDFPESEKNYTLKELAAFFDRETVLLKESFIKECKQLGELYNHNYNISEKEQARIYNWIQNEQRKIVDIKLANSEPDEAGDLDTKIIAKYLNNSMQRNKIFGWKFEDEMDCYIKYTKITAIMHYSDDSDIVHEKTVAGFVETCGREALNWFIKNFHDTDPISYEQPLNVIPAATKRYNLSVAEPMKLSVGSFHLTIPNGTDPQLLAQTLRIVKELGC